MYFYSNNEIKKFPNTEAGIKAFIKPVVLEATGNYSMKLTFGLQMFGAEPQTEQRVYPGRMLSTTKTDEKDVALALYGLQRP
jgi:transposase